MSAISAGVATVDRPTMSVVVPVYKCRECLDDLSERLERTLEQLTNRYEIILVDDRSPDGAWQAILSLRSRHPALRAIRLSRNFGQHIAITAGLAASRGDLVAVLDCDLQDPPELIGEMFSKVSQGYDLVLARRIARTHSSLRILASAAYFSLLGRMTRARFDGAYGCYSLLTRKVVDAFLTFKERERHYLFVLRWLGFNMATVDYEQQERLHGSSAYSFRRLIRHAMDGVFFQTTVLLEWIVGLGLLFAACGLIWAIVLIYHYIISDPPAGFTTLAVLVLVSTGIIITSLGVVGLYIGKTFEQSKERPLYTVDTVVDCTLQW